MSERAEVAERSSGERAKGIPVGNTKVANQICGQNYAQSVDALEQAPENCTMEVVRLRFRSSASLFVDGLCVPGPAEKPGGQDRDHGD